MVDFFFFSICLFALSLTRSPLSPPLWLNHVAKGMGMGLDLYSSSPVACAVWDSADAHLISAYGFSIVGIVRENPKKKTTHFGGVKAHFSLSLSSMAKL